MTFQQIRQDLKTKRRLLSQEAQTAAAINVAKQLLQWPLLPKTPAQIAVYLAHGGELDLGPTIDMLWQQGHHLYLPTLAQDDSLRFARYEKNSALQKNAFGISEPMTTDFKNPQDLDMALVPLLAFDKAKHRIGMGKGCYDKTFAFRTHHSKPLLIGCAYAFQEIPVFEPEAHDIPMDVILAA